MKHELTAKRLSLAMSNIQITQQELANKSGVSKASISQYVNGSHVPSNISSGKMSKILYVDPLWLMGFDVSMEYKENLYQNKENLYLTDTEVEIIKAYRNCEYKQAVLDILHIPFKKGSALSENAG